MMLVACAGSDATEQTTNAIECGNRLTKCQGYCEPWTIPAEKQNCLDGCQASYSDCIQYGPSPEE